MNPKQKKLFIILIPIVVIVIIAITLIILYLTTDFLKSNQTLFFKYVSQNVEAAISIIDNTSEKEYTKLLHQNKYEINSELTGEVTQSANTQTDETNINKLKLQLNGQSDYQNSYDYRNVELVYGNNTILGAECIHDSDIYGVKFTDVFAQFVSAENNNLKELAQKCGMDEENIENIPDRIEEIDLNQLLSLTYEQTTKLKETYLNLLEDNISADNYTKQKNAIVTINDTSYTANEYTLTLTEEQANAVYIKLLQQLENDEIVLSKITEVCEALSMDSEEIEQVKEQYTKGIEDKITEIQDNNIGTDLITYTVYQVKGKTIRTMIKSNQEEITIDLNNTEETTDVTIGTTVASELDETTNVVRIIKTNTANNDEFSIETQNIAGETSTTSRIYRNKTIEGSNINVETGLVLSSESLDIAFRYNEDINVVSEIERAVQLDDQNNVILNNYSQEQVSQILNLVQEKLTAKINENEEIFNEVTNEINSLFPNANGTISLNTNGNNTENDVNIEQSEEMSEVEKNRFNSKFEFYAGTELSSEDIQKLLDVVKDNLNTAQVSYSKEEATTTNDNKKLQAIRLKIEKDKQNKELADSVMDLIEESKKYTVTLQYDEDTNIINYITIEVNK